MTVKSKTEFRLANFVAASRNIGFARPTHFEVEITQPACIRKSGAIRAVSLLCKSALLPQTRINTSRLQIFGPPIFSPIGVDYGGDNLTLSFYMDQQLNVKAFFDEWVDGMVNRQSGLHYYFGEYATSLKIKQLDQQQRVVYIANFQDAFPVSINPMMMDFNSTGQVHELSVTFNYRRWTYETVSYNVDGDESSQAGASLNQKPRTDNQRGSPTNNRNPANSRSIVNNSWKNTA